jgi:8-hydroxy-5-deazaflavin:NADPH oxidoreductase
MSTIAIIGGTGAQGTGLGYRFARGGHDVIVGSRSEERAIEAATQLDQRLTGSGSVRGALNTKAAEVADLVLLAVPFDALDDLVASLAPQLTGKIVVSCVNPLGFDRAGPYGLNLGSTSAAEMTQALVPDATVVGAFHHLGAVSLMGEKDVLHREDVLVCGDDTAAKAAIVDLAATVTGKLGVDAGPLRLARELELVTAVLISISRRYRVPVGMAVAGLERGA